MKKNSARRSVKKFLLLQAGFCALVALAVLLTGGGHQGVSALLGGLVAILPSMVFAKKFFRYEGARAAKKIVKSFYVGECLKIVLSVLLFVLVFASYKVAPIEFFLTYIAMLMTHWFAPLIIDNKQNRPESD